jgi:GntR family transcriptional regulator
MIFRISETDARPIYVQIMDEIRRAIVVEAIEPDEALPSVRQMAGDLRVNPNTVQQAYRELEREGVVYVRRGQGTFVANAETPAKERRRLLGDVAKRALVDAHRHGFTAEELMEAIAKAAGRGEGSQ